MIAVPWNPQQQKIRSWKMAAGPSPRVQQGQPYMYAQPMPQIVTVNGGAVNDVRYGNPTPYPDPSMVENMQMHSPPQTGKNRWKVNNRWETEYRYQFTSAQPRRVKRGNQFTSDQVAAALQHGDSGALQQHSAPPPQQYQQSHPQQEHGQQQNHQHDHPHHHPHHGGDEEGPGCSGEEASEEVVEADAIATAAQAAADRAVAAAQQAKNAASMMRSRKKGGARSGGTPRRPSSSGGTPRRPSSSGGRPASQRGAPADSAQYNAGAYAPSPQKNEERKRWPGPNKEFVPYEIEMEEEAARNHLEEGDMPGMMMVPAHHVCKENAVHTMKEPNPQSFLQGECQKCFSEPAEEPALFVPFEPQTFVERNPKMYKYMPQELLHFVPPAGKPINRDYPAAYCLDVYD